MARSINDVAQEQLGSLMLQLAMQVVQIESLTEENAKLKAQIAEQEQAAKARKVEEEKI